jgi:hypothetical protein
MTTTALMTKRVHEYFEACNQADADLLRRCAREDVVHYLPDGHPSPVVGIEPVMALWGADVATNGSYWRVDQVAADPERRVAVCEWTSVKPGLGVLLRGAELYEFDGGADCMITEVRVYYASPRHAQRTTYELGGFPYAERGWHVATRGVTG